MQGTEGAHVVAYSREPLMPCRPSPSGALSRQRPMAAAGEALGPLSPGALACSCLQCQQSLMRVPPTCQMTLMETKEVKNQVHWEQCRVP